MSYDLIALLFTVASGLLMLTLPRKWAAAPLLVVAVLMPLGQYVDVGGLHFYMTRILIVFGCVRLVVQRNSGPRRFNAIDKLMVLWVTTDVVARILLLQTSDAMINRLGYAYNVLGVYFLMRYFVLDIEDLRRVTRILVFISVVVAGAMLVEKTTGRNAFAVFGGVPAISEVRLGRIRAQGPFEHSILAGTFGAVMLPLFVSLGWGTRKHKALVLLGVAAATAITVLSASSTPALSYLAGIGALCLWPLRKHMRVVRWGVVCMLVGLQIVMKAPVWALIARVGVISGSTAYHREILVDQFIRRIGEWWFVGVASTAGWGDKYMLLGDVTNHYVELGVQGGLITLVLFIAMIAYCFRGLGVARRAFEGDAALERMCWAFGAALFVHLVAFMGVSYFDQIACVWYAFLALIAALASLGTARASSESTSFAGAHLLADLPGRNPQFGPSLARAHRVVR